MIYSTGSAYAVRALTRLVDAGPRSLTKLRTLAERDSIPPAFLAKIFQQLTETGLLRSAKGPTGGYALARSPEKITLYDIRKAVDGTADLEACAVGLAGCSDRTPCPLHDVWKPRRREIERFLREVTLRQLAVALAAKEALMTRRRVSA